METSHEVMQRPDGGYADVGASVAAILEAAEQAAERIRADARMQAGDLVREAEQAVAARLQTLTRDAERMRNEAEAHAEQLRSDADLEARNMRLAAESYGQRLEREAEENAARMAHEAEEHARKIVTAATDRASEAKAAVEARVARLGEELRALETRRDQALEVLTKISAALDAAVADARRAEQRAPDLNHVLDPTQRRDRGRTRR